MKTILLIALACSHHITSTSRAEKLAAKKAEKKEGRRDRAAIKLVTTQLNDIRKNYATSITQLSDSRQNIESALDTNLLPKPNYSSTYFTDPYESTRLAANDLLHTLMEQTGAQGFEKVVDKQKSSEVQMMQTVLHLAVAQLQKTITINPVFSKEGVEPIIPILQYSILTNDEIGRFTDCYKSFLSLYHPPITTVPEQQTFRAFKDSLHALLTITNAQPYLSEHFADMILPSNNSSAEPAGTTFTEITEKIKANIQHHNQLAMSGPPEPTLEEVNALYAMVDSHSNPEECLLNILFGKALQILAVWGHGTAQFTNCLRALNQHRLQVEARNKGLSSQSTVLVADPVTPGDQKR